MNKSGQYYSKIEKQLKILYGDKSSDVLGKIIKLTEEWKVNLNNRGNRNMPDQTDAILITYADAIQAEKEKPLTALLKFLKHYVGDAVTAVHILPFFPYTSDDGFSITNYCEVNEEFGDWNDIRKLSEHYKLMADLVLNHVSKSSPWFEGFIKHDERYMDYFITADPNHDFSKVIRPRTSPLLTPFETKDGTKYVWTTFSPDQVDLNFSNPEVLLEILTVLLTYVSYGARFIRLDAVGFIWKEPGTNCMHLQQAHAIVKLLRAVLDEAAPGTIIITETNVPHEENITYLGGGDEAHMIYQFPLPPLTMFTLLSGNATKLSQWAKSLESTRLNEYNTYLNFLASHDGIGLRPAEGILDENEKELLIKAVIENGGRISYKTNKDGSASPYELNISYMDGITNSSKPMEERFRRFIAAQAVMLSMKGIPGIYYHSLLGSGNWPEGVETSGINRRINRQKLDYNSLTDQLDDKSSLRNMVLTAYKKLLEIRSRHSAFSPFAHQKVLDFSPSVFALERYNPDTKEKIITVINVTDKSVKLNEPIKGIDLLGSGNIETITQMMPYQIAWILV